MDVVVLMFPPRIRLPAGPRWLLFVGVGIGWYYLLMVLGVVFDDMATFRIGPYTLEKLTRASQNTLLHTFAAVSLTLLGLWALLGWSRERRTAPQQAK
ncbi:MAG: hypothetical protein HY558_07855 [Euryarchaeota archaeon]|nr:hypothetical protein [Euryarchaeota archaeon]